MKITSSKAMQHVMLIIEPALHEKGQALAVKRDQSFSALLRTLLRAALAAEAAEAKCKKIT